MNNVTAFDNSFLLTTALSDKKRAVFRAASNYSWVELAQVTISKMNRRGC